MKLTKSKLKQLIKEEILLEMEESNDRAPWRAGHTDRARDDRATWRSHHRDRPPQTGKGADPAHNARSAEATVGDVKLKAVEDDAAGIITVTLSFPPWAGRDGRFQEQHPERAALKDKIQQSGQDNGEWVFMGSVITRKRFRKQHAEKQPNKRHAEWGETNNVEDAIEDVKNILLNLQAEE